MAEHADARSPVATKSARTPVIVCRSSGCASELGDHRYELRHSFVWSETVAGKNTAPLLILSP